MIKIRPPQVEALSKASLRSFEDRMLAHLREYFPVKCTPMKEEEIRREIRRGMEKANTYGFTTEREICLFTDLMFAFGPEFDKDPKHPWAGGILRDKSYPDSQTRIDQLYEVGQHKWKEESQKGV